MKFFLVLSMFLITISSCKKNNWTDIIECSEGYIFWGGDPGADGAGWYYAAARYSQPLYQIENPPNTFKVDGIAVYICLKETNKPVICGMGCHSTRPYYYEIKEIKKL